MRSQSLIKAQDKYRDNNRDKINEKANKKIKCDCGCVVSYSIIARHRKSNKHTKNLLEK